jgi:FtsH-binding integral membrane protein
MNRPIFRAEAQANPDLGVAFHDGLRRHMLGIYNNMALGLVVTGLVALASRARPLSTSRFSARL